MVNPGALITMPLKKKAVTSGVNLKASKELLAWIDKLVELNRCGTRVQLVKNALQDIAVKSDLKEPMPKR